MKKLIAILLVAVMCLSLAACGGGEKDTTAVFLGKWDGGNGEVQLVVNEDKTGELTYEGETVAFTWVYDENSSMMVVTPEDESYNVLSFTYIEENDTLYNTWYVMSRVD